MNGMLVLALCLMGSFSGFAAGLLGIGGGVILVPLITMVLNALHFPHETVVHMAIATALATIMFTSISSVRAHHLQRAVLWPVVRLLAPGILVGSGCVSLLCPCVAHPRLAWVQPAKAGSARDRT